MFIIREVNSDMPIFVTRTNAGKIKCTERDSNPLHPELMKGALTGLGISSVDRRDESS